MKRPISCLILLLILIIPLSLAQAHEAYVLTKSEWAYGTRHIGFDAFYALGSESNLKVFIVITLAVLLALFLNFIFRQTRLGQHLHRGIERYAKYGPPVVRVAFAVSLFFSALTWSFLGPEITLHAFPFAIYLRVALFVISVAIFFNLLTDVMALAALVIYVVAASKYGWYVLTYLNYFGEMVALILFSGRKLINSRWETPILRVCYGLALSYAAINVKFLHPVLTEIVVNRYHLTEFHWLFPSDPLLVTLGAALAELAIGLFIILGFELRLTVLISVFYITLSLLYFREAVWPHLLLYGISFSLFVGSESWSLDSWLLKRFPVFGRRS